MRTPKRAIQNMIVLSLAVAMLKVRKMPDVTARAVNITKDKKILNQKRKLLKKIEDELQSIIDLADNILSKLSIEDLKRISKSYSIDIIQTIPETSTNPEILALNLLYINFYDEVDNKLFEPLKPLMEIDYMDLIIKVSEEIGLEKNVSEDMYPLAKNLIMEIKR